MKTILFIVFVPFFLQSQKIATYGHIPNGKHFFDVYISKAGDTLKLGDDITINIPSADWGFKYITQGGQRGADFLADKTVKITKIRTYPDKRFAGTIYLQFKGYGMLPVDINYETALKTEEIMPPIKNQ